MLTLAIAYKLTLSVGFYLCAMAILETRAPVSAKGSIVSRIVLQKRERRHLYAITCVTLAIAHVTFAPEVAGHQTYVKLPVLGTVVVAYVLLTLFCGHDAIKRRRRGYVWQVAFGIVTLAYLVVTASWPLTGPDDGATVMHVVGACTFPMLAGLLYLSAQEAPFGRSTTGCRDRGLLG